MSEPALTIIRSPGDEVGRLGVKFLVDQLERGVNSTPQLMPGPLMLGRSPSGWAMFHRPPATCHLRRPPARRAGAARWRAGAAAGASQRHRRDLLPRSVGGRSGRVAGHPRGNGELADCHACGLVINHGRTMTTTGCLDCPIRTPAGSSPMSRWRRPAHTFPVRRRAADQAGPGVSRVGGGRGRLCVSTTD